LCTSSAATALSTPPESPQSTLRADPLDLLLDHGRRGPRRRGARDPVEEVLEDLLPVRGVHHLGVELDPVEAAARRLERGDRRRLGAGHDARALGRRHDRVAVRHPHRLLLRQVVEEAALLRLQLRLAELAGAPLDAAAELLRHQVHPVADAERRHAELEQPRVDARGALGVHRRGAAGQDQRGRVSAAELVGGRAVRDELGVDARLSHPAGDQLRVLAAEVEDEHRTVVVHRAIVAEAGLRRRVAPQRDDLSCAGNWARPW
jgi:hypothetical protein